MSLPTATGSLASEFTAPLHAAAALDYAVEAEGEGLASLWFRYQGRYAERARDPQTDTDICFSGRIAITQVHLCSGAPR